MIEERGTDWRTILLATGTAGGVLLSFGGAVVLLLFAVLDGAGPDFGSAHRSALDIVVLASAMAVVGVVFVAALYYCVVRLSGREIPAANPQQLRFWQGLLLILVWVGAALGAGLLVDKPIIKWATPVLYLLAIGVPVYFFARLATGGLQTGSRQRFWGVMAAGIELGITPAIIAELFLALLALIGVVVYLALHPDQLATFRQLASELENTGDPEQLINTAGAWLSSPVMLGIALVFFSVFAPLVEETAKSLAVWSVFDRLASPAQGFALGAISGAAFGLVESLLVSASPDSNWTMTLLVRGASTMMHIMAASLTGWGIGQFRRTHRFSRLFGMYVAAFCLHGLWNASVVVITFGSLRMANVSAGADAAGILLTFAGGGLLLMLCLGIPLGMWGINRGLRAAEGFGDAGTGGRPDAPALPAAREEEHEEAEAGHPVSLPPATG